MDIHNTGFHSIPLSNSSIARVLCHCLYGRITCFVAHSPVLHSFRDPRYRRRWWKWDYFYRLELVANPSGNARKIRRRGIQTNDQKC